MALTLIGLFAVFANIDLLAASGDKLFINGENVNIRSGPGTDFEIVTTLDRGHELIEFGREGDWINVGIARADGRDGWVLSTLVAASDPGGMAVARPSVAFTKFRISVDALNQSMERQIGATLYSDVRDIGDGIVQLTATPTWLAASLPDRESNLETLFKIWSAAEGTGQPIRVRIVDGNGQLIMEKNRK